MKNRILYKTFE